MLSLRALICVVLAASVVIAEQETSAVATDAGTATADNKVQIAAGLEAMNAAMSEQTSESTSEDSVDSHVESMLATQSSVSTDADASAQATSEMESQLDLSVDAEGPKGSGPVISCQDAKTRKIRNKAGTTKSGVYRIDPQDGQGGFDIYCDQETDGGGWNVFSRRVDGSVDFYKPWVDYKNGFGKPSGDYWLGLDRVHRMTNILPAKLRISLRAFTRDNGGKYGQWNNFFIANESKKYRLTVSKFEDHGVGNSLAYHSGRPFSTYDHDNDQWSSNCAAYFHGAWWYGACHHSNLNGKYYRYPGSHPSHYADGADWLTFRGHFESAKEVKMMFK